MTANQERKPKTCKCIELFNKELESQNVQLDTYEGFQIDKGTATMKFVREMRIPIRKINTHLNTKLPIVIVTYCPICGRKVNSPKKSKAVRKAKST